MLVMRCQGRAVTNLVRPRSRTSGSSAPRGSARRPAAARTWLRPARPADPGGQAGSKGEGSSPPAHPGRRLRWPF